MFRNPLPSLILILLIFSACKPTPKAAVSPSVHLTQDADQIRISIDGTQVLQYNISVVEPPAGIASHYRRSGYIHPLFSPDGAVLTGDMSHDHAHQHGVFFAWVNTTFQGHKVDFWNQADKSGRIEHVAVLDTMSGPDFAQFRVKLRHSDITDSTQIVPVLEEEWTVTVHAQTDPFLIDFESKQVCIADSPLHLNQYHYGGMAFRGSNEWVVPEDSAKAPEANMRSAGLAGVLTSEGDTRIPGNHSRPKWVDMSGLVGGKTGGVTILQHPDNFRFQQFTRIHPSMPYYCYPPVVEEAYDLMPGVPFVSQYRIVSHTDRPDAQVLDSLWNGYVGE